jgi:hypothetical protein
MRQCDNAKPQLFSMPHHALVSHLTSNDTNCHDGMRYAHSASNGTPKTGSRCDWVDRPTGGICHAHQPFFPRRSQGTRRVWLDCGGAVSSCRCEPDWLWYLPAVHLAERDEDCGWKSVCVSNRCLGSNLERRRIRNRPGPSRTGVAAQIPLATLNQEPALTVRLKTFSLVAGR